MDRYRRNDFERRVQLDHDVRSGAAMLHWQQSKLYFYLLTSQGTESLNKNAGYSVSRMAKIIFIGYH